MSAELRFRYFTVVKSAARGRAVEMSTDQCGRACARLDVHVSTFDEWLLRGAVTDAARRALGKQSIEIMRVRPNLLAFDNLTAEELESPVLTCVSEADWQECTTWANECLRNAARRCGNLAEAADRCAGASDASEALAAINEFRQFLGADAGSFFDVIWQDVALEGPVSVMTDPMHTLRDRPRVTVAPPNAALVLDIPPELRHLKRVRPSSHSSKMPEIAGFVYRHVAMISELDGMHRTHALLDAARTVYFASEMLSQTWALSTHALERALGRVVTWHKAWADEAVVYLEGA